MEHGYMNAVIVDASCAIMKESLVLIKPGAGKTTDAQTVQVIEKKTGLKLLKQ